MDLKDRIHEDNKQFSEQEKKDLKEKAHKMLEQLDEWDRIIKEASERGNREEMIEIINIDRKFRLSQNFNKK